MSSSRSRLLVELLTARVSGDAASWLREALAAVERSPDALGRAWSGAGRRLGRSQVALLDDERASLAAAGASFQPHGWGSDEWGRALLLCAALEDCGPEAQVALVEELFRTGEVRERQAVLRVLAALPGPARFAPLAAEAVRNNMLSVVEAIACDNTFPAAHLDDGAFNQMVMKCLFNGLPLGRVIGLGGRRNVELLRIVGSWVDERRAAGRPIPDDVNLILGG